MRSNQRGLFYWLEIDAPTHLNRASEPAKKLTEKVTAKVLALGCWNRGAEDNKKALSCWKKRAFLSFRVHLKTLKKIQYGDLGRNRTTAFTGHSGDFPEKLLHKLLQTAPQTFELLSIWPFNQTH